MAAATKLPKGTILRYKAVGDQPQRTMLVLADGQLRCLRVGEKTWKNHQLVTYPSLEAFLSIIPAHEQEEFTVEFGTDHGHSHDALYALAQDYAKASGQTWVYHYMQICQALRDDHHNKAEQYLLTLGHAGESPEGGYKFYRKVPAVNALCYEDEPVGYQQPSFLEPLPKLKRVRISPPPWDRRVQPKRACKRV